MPLRVAVLCGGRSGEHEISLRSAESIVAGLDRAKYEVQRIFIKHVSCASTRQESKNLDRMLSFDAADVVFCTASGMLIPHDNLLVWLKYSPSDWFSGVREYATGEPGSPIVALKAILEH